MDLAGRRIGNLRVIERLAQGGAGTVWVAFDEALERRVAIKALRSDRLRGSARERLQREARLLSRLRHPNICTVYDLIETDDEVFLVLELVEGRDLARAREEEIPPKRRLEIALAIARALEAAHAEGIVHRDLKLENVMVADDDTVKVLDFGLAVVDARADAGVDEVVPAKGSLETIRRLSSESSTPGDDRTITEAPSTDYSGYLTEEGALVGTLRAMSPEQAVGEPVGPAGDLYSFGILLQELETGRHAYPGGLSRLRLLEHVAAAATVPLVGVDGELAGLIGDLLSPEPGARPPASEARRRLVRILDRPRRRARRAMIAAIVLLAILGTAKYVHDLGAERDRAVRAREQAEAARRESDEVLDFVLDLFATADPRVALGEDVTARRMLEVGAERLASGELDEVPRVRSRLLGTLGDVERESGRLAAAEPLLEESLAILERQLPADSPELADALLRLGELRAEQRDPEALGRFEHALALRRAKSGESAENEAAVAEVLVAMAAWYREREDLDRARDLLDQALEIQRRTLGADAPEIADTLYQLSGVEIRAKNHPAAQRWLEETLARREATLPELHPDRIAAVEALGVLYAEQGKWAEAEGYYRRALDTWRRLLEEDHPHIARCKTNLGRSILFQERFDEAEPLFLESLETRERVLGPDHPDIAATLINLAQLEATVGRLDEAAARTRRAISIALAEGGEEHPRLPGYRNLLAEIEALQRGPSELAGAASSR